LNKIALEVSSESSVNGLGIPQKKALDWILKNNNTRFVPEKDRNQIMQRYQLATLYFSTNGENWTNNGNFLSADDECNWYKEAVMCAEDGRITEISLGRQFLF